MQLDEYLEKHQIGIEDFCRKVGISRSALFLYRKGKFRPSVHTAMRIQEETNGEVTFDDLRYKICDLCKEKMNEK